MTGAAKTVIDTNGRYIDVLTDPILAGEDACRGGRIEHLVKSINQKRAMVYSRMAGGRPSFGRGGFSFAGRGFTTNLTPKPENKLKTLPNRGSTSPPNIL